MKVLGTISLVLAVAATAAQAHNITIPDGMARNGATWPWRGLPGCNAGNEDNETEPRTYTGDLWDLEAFLLEGTRLSIVGTYDLKHGVPQYHVQSGDIFFDTVGGVSTDGFSGWEYVIHVDWLAGSYQVYANPDPARMLRVTDVVWSNPFAYQPGPNELALVTGVFEYRQDNSLGFLSASPDAVHNVATFDISFLGGAEFTAHFTMTCGNDLLLGHGQGIAAAPRPLPDSGTSLSLMAWALVGLWGLRWRLTPASPMAKTARSGVRTLP